MIATGGGVPNQDEPGHPASVAVLERDADVLSQGITAAPRAKPSRRTLMLALLAAGLLILGIGAFVANSVLSESYSARRAVQDYFNAQSHRNVDGMLANATFLRGEGSYGVFFDKTMLEGMMQLPANSAISNLQITSVRDADSDTKSISVSLTWNGTKRDETLAVRKDTSRMHWLFYPSWRVQIPFSTIDVGLPNQAGRISIDGVDTPPGANQAELETIMGYHLVAMAGTDILDSASQTVGALSPDASVTFEAKLNAAALDSAKNAIVDAFNNCDPAKYDDCINHTYKAPDSNYIYYFDAPGYGQINYASYRYAILGDPTTGMKLTVEKDTGKVSVSGSCARSLTVDGSRHYSFKGTYTGTLTWEDGGFNSDIYGDCEAQKG
jgi:hypothetical protein